jgi:hypothetical protein
MLTVQPQEHHHVRVEPDPNGSSKGDDSQERYG